MNSDSKISSFTKVNDICCCCGKSGCEKDITSEYYYLGQKEIYDTMLKSTFNIQILRTEKLPQRIICEECVCQLRTAATFKDTVLNTERKLKDYLDNLGKESDKPLQSLGVKVSVKEESYSSDLDFDSHDVDIKAETANHELLNSLSATVRIGVGPYSKNRNSAPGKVKLKKCKIKLENQDVKSTVQKDWSKIVERRGNGPILRENSLKLLANSNICVFQWNKSRYRCFCCKEPFSDLAFLREHTRKHSLDEIEKKIILQQNRLVKVEVSFINCNICAMQLATLPELRRHLVEKHDISFATDDDLLVPFKINGELQCQLCSENFTVFRLLNIHMNKHFQKQVCHICGTGFSNLVFLNLHKTRSHRPLSCKLCNVTFSNKTEKKTHEKTTHGVKFEKKLRFPCPYCQERFFQENFRVQHLVEKHGMTKPEYKCNVCQKVFITRSLKNNHVKHVHMKEKNQECDICHHLFYTKSDVSRHRVVHTGEKKFACAVCNSPFATKDSLRRHMKRTHVQ